MASRDNDKHADNPSAQQALQDYLDQMLGIRREPDADASRDTAAAPDAAAPPAAPSPVAVTAAAATPARSDSREKTGAVATALADHADTLQQKLVQARVKDLTEKSLQNLKASAQQASAEADRRERLAAARALVKQRIAARMTHAAPASVDEQPQQPPTPASVEAVAKESAAAADLPPAPQWLKNGRPVWAQAAFECLLFSVSGLTLAVPLIELGSIYPLRENLTPIIGQIDWFLGLMHIDGRKHLRTVNTAKIVMPEKYDPAFVDQIRYVISINGHDWGLAVDRIDKAITLKPDDVRWRSERSRRPWLAGTVVDYMCALVDVQELALMLSRDDHGRPQSRH